MSKKVDILRYCAMLHLEPGASFEEIRASYKRLVILLHPDRHSGSKAAEEHFKKVGEAYDYLEKFYRGPAINTPYDVNQERSDPPSPNKNYQSSTSSKSGSSKSKTHSPNFSQNQRLVFSSSLWNRLVTRSKEVENTMSIALLGEREGNDYHLFLGIPLDEMARKRGIDDLFKVTSEIAYVPGLFRIDNNFRKYDLDEMVSAYSKTNPLRSKVFIFPNEVMAYQIVPNGESWKVNKANFEHPGNILEIRTSAIFSNYAQVWSKEIQKVIKKHINNFR